MRISSLIAAVENVSINVGSKLFVAGKDFMDDVSKEAAVRAQYKAETAAVRRARLDELRALAEQQDVMVMRAAQAKAKRVVAKAKRKAR